MVWEKVVELIVSYGLAGILFAIAARFLMEGQTVWAIGFAIAATVAFFFFNFLKAVLDLVQEQLKQPIANWIVRQLDVFWWRLTSRFRSRYTQQLIYAFRDFRTQGLKTKGPFALDLERVFVPLRVAPESLNKIPAAMIQPATDDAQQSIWRFLASATRQPAFRRLVAIAPPGSGKTTLLEHLTLVYAQNDQRRYHRQAPRLLPILVYLREVREAITGDSPPVLADLVHEQQAELTPPPNWFAHQLQQGRCLVMLDGLDEVADTRQRQAVSRWVDQQMSRYPRNGFILTSRPFGYRSAPLTSEVVVLEVKPFSLQQMTQFIHNWYLQNEIMRHGGTDDPGVRAAATRQAQDLTHRIRHAPPLAAMAVNPLLLTMLATVHCYRGALPGRRVELYDEICDVLLGRRQEAKGLPPDRLSAIQKKSVLQQLALNRMRKKTPEFTLLTAGLLIQERLAAVAGDDLYPDDFLHHIERISGLIVEKHPGVYEFAHKSFMEYLAAVQIKEANQELLLTRNIDDPWWEETICLYAAQSDASNLIWAALQKSTVGALTLAYECLEEGLSVGDRDVRKELEEALDQGLESTDVDRFKLAAEVKLARRLKGLLRLDERRAIDPTYITQAEYQLFINAKQASGEAVHPDHWTGTQFLSGTAQQAVVGVRAADATAFCQWLTEHTAHLGDTYVEGGTAVFVGALHYRLPTLQEAEETPTGDRHIGCWSLHDGYTLADLPLTTREDLARSLVPIIETTFHADCETAQKTQFRLSPPYRSPQGPGARPSRYDEAITLKQLNAALPSALQQYLPGLQGTVRSLYGAEPLLRLYSRVLIAAPQLNYSFSSRWKQARDFGAEGSVRLAMYEISRQGNLFYDGRKFKESLALIQALETYLVSCQAYPLLDDVFQRQTLADPEHTRLGRARVYLIHALLIWRLLSAFFQQVTRNRRLTDAATLDPQTYRAISDRYAQEARWVFEFYLHVVVLEARVTAQLPAWEGIRIVQERYDRP